MWGRLPAVADPVQRRGQWWQQQPDQTWLKWDETDGRWEPQEFPPPPPEPGESIPQSATPTGATRGPAGPDAVSVPPVGGVPASAGPATTALAPTPGYKYARGADGTWWARDESTGELHWHDAAAAQWRRYIDTSSAAAASPTATDLDHAGFWMRAGAFLIDLVLVSVVGFGLGYLLAQVTQGSTVAATPEEEASLALFFNGVGVVAQWLYFALMESSSKQGTLGKMALGIRVTDVDGRRIGFGKATGRYFGKYLSALILFVGFLMAAWTQKKQALHDLMANTLVLRGRPSGEVSES